MAQPAAKSASAEAVTVTKATVRAAEYLALNNQTLAAILGISEPSVSRMTKGKYFLQPSTKEFELGVLFVRLYRSLDAMVDGDSTVAKSWLNNQNVIWRDAPINIIQRITGLANVINYLDARRARI